MAMLAPDLLDRRALALLRFVDVGGRAVDAPLRIEADRARLVAKGGGRYALLEVAGLEAYSGRFDPMPATPVAGSVAFRLDVTPASAALAPRAFILPLPRDMDPAHAAAPASIFAPVSVELLPGPAAEPPPGGCAVHVSVRRADDGRAVEHALVRGRSDSGTYTARALTDARGEACLIFTGLPLAFPRAGGGVQHETAARILVAVDAMTALFHATPDLVAARAAADARTRGHPDPDAFSDAAPAAFAAGEPVTLAAGGSRAIAVAWSST